MNDRTSGRMAGSANKGRRGDGAGISLLLVEDERDTLNLYSAIFSKHLPQVSVYTATNPEEAIVSFKKHRHKVIVTDYRVPNKGDGLRIARAVCEYDSTATVYIVTADADLVSTMIKENQEGIHCIQAVLAKPVDLRDLIRRVERAITLSN